jgi:hypothetical protein
MKKCAKAYVFWKNASVESRKGQTVPTAQRMGEGICATCFIGKYLGMLEPGIDPFLNYLNNPQYIPLGNCWPLEFRPKSYGNSGS